MFWFSILQICQKFRYCSRLHKKVELTCDATHPNKKNWRFMSAVFLLPPSGQKTPKSVIAPLKAWAHPQKCQGICPYCTRLQSEAIFRHNRWQVEQEDKISPLLSCHKIEGNIFTRAGSVIDNKYVRKPRDLHQQLQHLFQLHTTRVTCNATLISSSYGCTQRDKTRHKKNNFPSRYNSLLDNKILIRHKRVTRRRFGTFWMHNCSFWKKQSVCLWIRYSFDLLTHINIRHLTCKQPTVWLIRRLIQEVAGQPGRRGGLQGQKGWRRRS